MGASFLVERLEQLIKSGTAIFDILPSFVYHRNPLVRVAALEVMYGVCVGGGEVHRLPGTTRDVCVCVCVCGRKMMT